MMTIKINETGEIKTLEMLDAKSGTDNVRDFVGNGGGFGASGQFATVDGDGYQFTSSQADYDWWSRVIGDHSALDSRIASLIEEHGRAEVMDALEGAYDCDLEDQAAAANRALDEAFGKMVTTSKYKLIDGTSGVSKEIEADDMDTAKIKAEEWMREGGWDTSDGTIWVRVHVVDLDALQHAKDSAENEDEVDERDHYETVEVTIEPDEPNCSSAEGHDWQSPIEIVGGIKENPGVWGHGGGVVSHEVCMHCGCERVTDTWAQNPETGEQGLNSVKYHAGKYADEVEKLRSNDEEEVA